MQLIHNNTIQKIRESTDIVINLHFMAECY